MNSSLSRYRKLEMIKTNCVVFKPLKNQLLSEPEYRYVIKRKKLRYSESQKNYPEIDSA
jgi:hypothetical protein